jgi:hypothetical protein
MRMFLPLLLLSFAAVSKALKGCIKCAAGDNVCVEHNAASVWSESGKCIFNAIMKGKDVFYTGHVFSLGVCPAVQLNVGKKCFREMAGSIAVQLGSNATKFDRSAVCKIAPEQTPCMYGSRKFEFTTEGYNCADIKILADNVVEECIRNDGDGRFWATLAYWMAVFIMPILLVICCGMCFK